MNHVKLSRCWNSGIFELMSLYSFTDHLKKIFSMANSCKKESLNKRSNIYVVSYLRNSILFIERIQLKRINLF